MCGGGGNNSRQQQAQFDAQTKLQEQADGERRDNEIRRKNTIREGTADINNTFAGFDDGFYARRGQEYTDYALPEVDRQFGEARDDLTYRLSDAGTLRSSVAAKSLGDLERDYGRQKLDVANRAREYGTSARGSVEQSRSQLIQQLNASGDIGQTNQLAAQQVPVIAATPQFSPIGQLFQDTGATIGNIRQGRQNADINSALNGTRLYENKSGGSGRVVN